MGWYYANGDHREGPVGDDALKDLARSGVLNGDTLVWCEGMTDWRPWAEITAQGPDRAVCMGCGAVVPKDTLVEIQRAHVCAACKPRHLQFLREGLTPRPVAGAGSGSRKGRLICTRGHPLAFRCVHCNAPARSSVERTFYWYPRWLLFYLIGGPIVLAVAYAFVRRKAEVEVPLCDAHLRRRHQKMLCGYLAILTGIALFTLSIATAPKSGIELEGGLMFWAGIILGLAGLVWVNHTADILTIRRIGNWTVEFSGAAPEYLASLPSWPADCD